MRLVVCCLNYAPELISTGKYTTEMTRWFVARGHEVRMVTGYPYYPEWRLWPGWPVWRYSRSKDSGVDVIRCPLWVPRHVSGPRRILHFLTFAWSATPVLLWCALWKPDYIVSVAPTIAVAPPVLIAARLCGSRSLLHVQDLEVDAAAGLGMLGTPGIGMRAALRFQDWIIRRFDLVAAISAEMAARIVQKGAAATSVVLVPNWVTHGLLEERGDGAAYRSQFGVKDGETLVLYSGNLGVKQGLEVALEALAILAQRGQPAIKLVLCGEGAARSRLVDLAESLGLANVAFAPLQPAESLGELLRSADIHMVTQRSGAAGTSMPSKLGGILASGRPVVVSAEPSSGLSRTVHEADAGVVVAPNDPEALADALASLSLCADVREVLGESGRAWAQAHLDEEEILGRMEATLLEALA